MALKWMLDTWAAVGLMRRRDEGLMRRVAELAPEEVCLSAISLGELRFGIEMSARPEQDREALDLLLRHVAVVGFGGEAAAGYGEMRVAAELRQEGVGVHALLVAAHARQMGVTLLSRDAGRLARLPGVVVVGWEPV
jgi:tRNA(fMet)-specific endonuclease VapC